MKILVTGSSGFVGRALCQALCVGQYDVLAAMRSESVVLANGVEPVVMGTISAGTDWKSVLLNVDVVVHLAARVHVMQDVALDPLAEFRQMNVDATLNLASQAAAAGVKRFVYVSSIKVNGELTRDLPFTEYDTPYPQDAYALSKWEAEQALHELAASTGMEVVIVRPPLVYGAGVKANFSSMMRAIKRGIPLPLGAIHNKRSFVYVGNLVSLILRCIDHPAAANQVFLVSDGHDLSTTALLRACAVALGVKHRLLPVPQSLIEIGATLLGKRDVAQRLCGNLQVDISKALTLLDWTPPVSVQDGLKATAINLIQGDK